ncbi:MAG: hypothetical protein CVT77_05865 [Alphaproteobacteria bacterium HGW-Alphaproteobacteria-16]|nr:MAG: hypothetical protein CVT77_05865 [Alphaproteobacteria bacterium HGW-Alphaproteobacteria-16]
MFATLIALTLSATTQDVTTVSQEDRSGASRRAACQIDGTARQNCVFTPLFGDGSFQIDLSDDTAYRIVIDEPGVASVFSVFGPDNRIPLMWSYRRDSAKPACWVTDTADVSPRAICVYAAN